VEVKGKLVIAILTAVTAAVFVVVLTQSTTPGRDGVGPRRAGAACTETGMGCLPAFDVRDTSGAQWNRDTLKGKVVIVNFWATWCQPCVQEIPELTQAYRTHKDEGLVILGVLADGASDSTLQAFRDQVGLGYPVVRATDELMEAFDYPDGLPTSLFYDRTGHLAYSELGALTTERLEKRLADLLAQPAP
jgi:thiol-disulfide isomerase/thioredoxin